MDTPTIRHRSFMLLDPTGTHKVPRPDFEMGDKLYFGEVIPAGWQIRPTITSDIPVGFAHATKPFILLRKFPGLVAYREYVLAQRTRAPQHFLRISCRETGRCAMTEDRFCRSRYRGALARGWLAGREKSDG